MPVFRIYQHNQKKNYQAVPVGFSLGAFLASFLWAGANSLWGKAFLLFLGFLLMGSAIGAGAYLNSPILMLSGVAGLALLPLWAGAQGQQWVCSHLEGQGYQLIKRINSESATKAIQAVKRREKANAAPAGKAEPSQQKGARFGKDFRDIRDNAAANSNQPPPSDFNARPWKRR
ncbi:hypothetical protein [Marinospirillum perlucidum]|uniref:hypothetical protein n=1 Tax=Marinospirillum perlucidum TaxID=1982602 RepID=UPI000DF3118C|nr:hypothetical protein [Marinospirillum perlucidum]